MLQVPKCRRSNMTHSKGRHKNENSSVTTITVKAERSGLSETAQTSTHESEQDATDDVGMSNTVSASVPLERGQPMTKQAETQKTGTVAVRRQEQLGVSSSEEHKTFHKTSRWGYSRAATRRGAGRARCRLARARVANDNRLHQTCRPINQYTHVCVEKCPLTTRHTARRSRDSCGMSDDRTREL